MADSAAGYGPRAVGGRFGAWFSLTLLQAPWLEVQGAKDPTPSNRISLIRGLAFQPGSAFWPTNEGVLKSSGAQTFAIVQ